MSNQFKKQIQKIAHNFFDDIFNMKNIDPIKIRIEFQKVLNKVLKNRKRVPYLRVKKSSLFKVREKVLHSRFK